MLILIEKIFGCVFYNIDDPYVTNEQRLTSISNLERNKKLTGEKSCGRNNTFADGYSFKFDTLYPGRLATELPAFRESLWFV